MNILFVNYGDFTTNSLNHIGGFANTLCAAGHACVVAVPEKKETVAHVSNPLFIPATYEELLTRLDLFPDGKPATLIHAWTPREGVRKFVLAYQRMTESPARLIVHLEDNERFLLEAYTGKSIEALRQATPAETQRWLVDDLPHPLRHEAFLRLADGITHIVARLAEFVPSGIPTQLLPPGVDFALYHPQPAAARWRAELGLRDDERVLVFTGSNTFANEPEMRELYVAVALLNQRGIPTRLVRTGFNAPKFLESLPADVKQHVIDLGFIPKARLPELLALADVLVQPGRAGPFNDYRLPSKLPEFLASGKPVALPPTNIALLMQDGREAVFLPIGTPTEIADTCAQLFAEPARCAALGERGLAFARENFDLGKNTRALETFYVEALARPPAIDWTLTQRLNVTETTLAARRLVDLCTTAGPDRATLASETTLLAELVTQLEQTLSTAGETAGLEAIDTSPRGQRPPHHTRQLEHLLAAERDNAARLEHARQLTKQHADNMERNAGQLEHLLAAERDNAARLGHARQLTKEHADNMERIAGQHRQRREQAEVLLRTARLQVVAYENALLGADAEIAALEDKLAGTRKDLETARAETKATADQVAHVEATVRARENKIATMQDSFSWRATAPLRALRRALLDRPAPPAPSSALLGNIDYPHDWTHVPPTLNVRGWSLHGERRPLRAVRARLGDRSVTAEFGLERLDVLDHFRDHPGAERCGWIVKVDVPRRGAHALVIEVQDETGAWHVAHSRVLRQTVDAPPPPPNSYGAWVAAYDTLTPEIADRIRQKLTRLQRRPLISVLMPVYNVPEKWLVRAIESVRRQLYDQWELCIADDASTQPHIRKVLERYQRKDPRIKVVQRETNGHISAASNSALALAHGEFIALLDHDDELRPHALACVALELDAHPEADLLYSDEDKIDENGHRYDQYFKPDWNPDLFLVQNYISHLGVYRTLLVREVGGFRGGYEGSQDWDLAMRVVERTAPDRIRHIPKILYHWRSVPGSTAMLIGAKSYAVTAAEKVITEHFARVGVTATISPTRGSYWRVHYPLPDPAPRVTLIMPTRNRLNVLRPCVESVLEKTTYPNFEILIVDNDSDDPETLAYLGQLTTESAPRVRVVRFPGEFNFSALNNYAATQTNAPVLGLINNDLTVIDGGWLTEMVGHAVRPEIGCVGAKLYYPDDRLQHAGVILGIGGVAAHAWQSHPRGAAGQAHRNLLQQNLSAVTAACLVIRREVFQAVGGFDEKLKVAFNDVDFCLKVRAAGYRNLWTPYAELYHHESASRGAEDTLEKRDRFRGEVEYITAKWGDALVNDPAYNPNLTLTINDFTLALPPRPWPPLDGA